MVAAIDGVVKLAPLPSKVPPEDASYQSIVVPVALDADRLTVPVPHREPFPGPVGAAGLVLTITVTVVVFVQMPAVAVMVNVVVCCAVVLFVNVPFMLAPVPVEGTPVRLDVLVRVQLNVVPATALGLEISI